MPRKVYPGTVAIVGGAGLLAWLLLRGRRGTSGSQRPAGNVRPCRVNVTAGGLVLDGQVKELRSIVEACRAADTAEVTASGDAVVGVVSELLAALQAAGVDVRADPDLWQMAARSPVRNRTKTDVNGPNLKEKT